MVTHCPHCGSPTDRPQLFSRTRQQIFNYIWDHPHCSTTDIELAIYGRFKRGSNVIGVHLSNIRSDLFYTQYRLRTSDRCHYTIVTDQSTIEHINKTIVKSTKDSSNAGL